MTQTAKPQKLDMLHGSLWDKLPRFALPVAATAILGQLFNASDLAVVGHFSGTSSTIAVAAVGANGSIVGLMVSFFLGIALGANVVIANAIGRGDEEDVHHAVHTAIVFSVLGGLFLTIVGELLSGHILEVLGVPDEVMPYAVLYLRIYLLGMPVILLYNFEAAIFRSIGDTRVPLETLALSGVLNVLMNLFFVIVLHMTVNGVATATVLSNAISAVVLLVRLCRTDKVVRVDLRALRIDFECLKRILKIGLPAGCQSAVFSVSNIVIQSAVNSLGTVVMAASSAAMNIEGFTYNVVNAYAQACTTFVGQNYGAGQLDRCRKTLKLSLLEGLLILAALLAVLLSFGKPLLSIFNSDPEVINTGYVRMMTVMFAHIFSLLYEVMSGYLRGFGISLVPAVLAIFGVCGVRIVWVATAFARSHTFQTLMLAYPISLSTTTLLILIALLVFHPSRKKA